MIAYRQNARRAGAPRDVDLNQTEWFQMKLSFHGRRSDEEEPMSILNRIDERTAMMGRMMETVGVGSFANTGLALEGQLRTAFFRCQACSSADQCKIWLAQHGGAAAAPGFCPNAAFFSAGVDRDGAAAR
jgi:hypothetical protein